MAFLDEQARAVLFEPPEAYDDAQARYALSSEDIAFAKEHRRSHNRLGFAIQLALVRDLGRLLRTGEVPPQAVVSVVADQLGVDPAVFGLYRREKPAPSGAWGRFGGSVSVPGLESVHNRTL
jgi:TnpA family transposase